MPPTNVGAALLVSVWAEGRASKNAASPALHHRLFMGFMIEASPQVPTIRKSVAPFAPITGSSVVLFRLGEACNNDCPFCSNSGRPEARLVAGASVLARVDTMAAMGVRRVVVTGGEPTIHPAFDALTERLQARGIRWDINTHGRSFADIDVMRRAVRRGLRRAIISLHHFDPAISARLFGAKIKAHEETLAGIAIALREGVKVMLNCVITQDNLTQLGELVDFCVAEFGPIGRFAMKFAFPSTAGKGGGWPGIHLSYSEVQPAIRALDANRGRWPVPIYFEGLPNCVIGRDDVSPMSRTGFGETHYLEDIDGDQLYAMEHVEADFAVYREECRACSAWERCPGAAASYAKRYGLGELKPFSGAATTDER